MQLELGIVSNIFPSLGIINRHRKAREDKLLWEHNLQCSHDSCAVCMCQLHIAQGKMVFKRVDGEIFSLSVIRHGTKMADKSSPPS